ncbi:MAG: c-type cytochrome biogenesis protein CcsB [Dissulfuribacterales bacterium]
MIKTLYELLLTGTLCLYTLATVVFLVQFITLKKRMERAAAGILCAGVLFHTIAIAVRWAQAGHIPLVHMHESLSFLSLVMVAGFLSAQLKKRLKSLGAFVTPFASVLLAVALTQEQRIVPLPPALQSIWLPIHATISIVSYAIFTISFLIAVMYLMQERQIKAKKLSGIFQRLPSLDGLDAILGRTLALGFAILTLGIITGSIWAEEAWGAYWSWDPKETWSLVTWLLYAAILHQRFTIGWRGRRAAIMTIIAFFVLIFTFLGVNLLIPGEHSYATRLQ